MKSILKNSYLTLVYFLLYIPIIVVIIYSFNEAHYSMLLTKFSFKWYNTVLSDQALWQSLANSIILAISSSTISCVFSVMISLAFYLYQFKFKQALFKTIFLMIIVPDIILAVGFLVFYSYFKIALGFTTLLIAHITFSLPFSLLLIQNRLVKVNKNLFAACQDLGASDFYAVRKVFFPLIKSASLSAWLLSFTLSFDDVLISYFTAGANFQILPLYIYSLIRTGITPEINALCTLVFLFSLMTVSLAYYFSNHKRVIQ